MTASSGAMSMTDHRRGRVVFRGGGGVNVVRIVVLGEIEIGGNETPATASARGGGGVRGSKGNEIRNGGGGGRGSELC